MTTSPRYHWMALGVMVVVAFVELLVLASQS